MRTLELLLTEKSNLLLDMNGTFMFGGDRFGTEVDYFPAYEKTGGTLSAAQVQSHVRGIYDYLAVRYPDPLWHDRFPSVLDALTAVSSAEIADAEKERLTEVFAHHECGQVSEAAASTIRRLAQTHRLALVADIWAPPDRWRKELDRAGILNCFQAVVFSSEVGCVKPSARMVQRALEHLGADPGDCLFIGDSAARDGGAAVAAGVEFLLVGKEHHEAESAHAASLDDVAQAIQTALPREKSGGTQ